MKSTKTIFVVALAALMLVAFTACQPNYNPTGKSVESVTLVSGDTEYLIGQPFDASRYSLEILYSDGNTEEKSGLGILYLADGQEDTAGAKNVEVTIGDYAGTIVVNYYDIDKVTISGAATTSVPQNTTSPDAIDLTGAVVTAYYANGGKFKELEANEYEVTSVTAVTVGEGKGGVFIRYTGVPTLPSDDVTENARYYASFAVDVVEVKTPALADVTSIKSATLKKDVFVTETPSTALAEANWEVIGETPYGDYTFGASEFDVSVPSSFSTSGSYLVEITASTPDVSYVTTVNVLKDLGSSITATGALAKTAGTNEDVQLTEAEFAALISATDAETSQAATGFTVTKLSQYVISRTSNTATVDIEFTWGGNGNVKTYTLSGINVNVTRS